MAEQENRLVERAFTLAGALFSVAGIDGLGNRDAVKTALSYTVGALSLVQPYLTVPVRIYHQFHSREFQNRSEK